jgi:hypothetical protein
MKRKKSKLLYEFDASINVTTEAGFYFHSPGKKFKITNIVWGGDRGMLFYDKVLKNHKLEVGDEIIIKIYLKKDIDK